MNQKETINTVGELIEFLQDNFNKNDILSASYVEYDPLGYIKKNVHKRPLLKTLFKKTASNIVDINELTY